jgi:triacylglycerol lipase
VMVLVIASLKRIVEYTIIYFISGVVLLSGCGAMNQSAKMIPVDNTKNECVILLHGLGRTYHSLDKMQKTLTQAGFHTVNFDYPSRKESIEQLAANHIPKAIKQCQDYEPDRIHFVAHSLGGIVARMALKQKKPDRLGRVVMLSPPNRGSEAADVLQERWYYSWVNGPAGQELSTAMDSIPNQLGPVDYPVGIIMGDRQTTFDAWALSWFSEPNYKVFSGPNDGKISVERAKLAGMTDFIIVHESHTFIMNSEQAQFQTVEFLNNEAFLHDNSVATEDIGHP